MIHRLRIHLFIWLAATCPWGMALHGETITTRDDAVGRSLNQWATEETAAGFGALQYENRDGGHSPLPDIYKRLNRVAHTQEEIKEGRDKGFPSQLRRMPTIGNCSMAGAPEVIGSLPRTMMMHGLGHEIISAQYAANNLIIYPEHMDHDPGANGVGGGWGDLFPVNHLGTLITQGSSHSDMPFVKAMLATAAAMRPEVQQHLIKMGVLMPALQAILRQCSTLVQAEEDYFTGKAHPVVFPESALDELKMVTTAQVMSLLSMPPVARVRVLSETPAQAGRDYFEVSGIESEILGSQPSCIARVFRRSAETFDLDVTSLPSSDPAGKPLTYRWVLLQGDPTLVNIHPSEDGSRAAIQVRWHPPIRSPGSEIRSHRVDIGLFVSNGLAWSAPATICIAMLPNEQRFFDDQGKLTEICYEAANPELGLPNDDNDPRWQEFEKALRTSTVLKAALKTPFLASRRDGAEQTIRAIMDQPDFFIRNQARLLPAAAKSPNKSALTNLRSELKRLTDLGVLVESADGDFSTAHNWDALTEADRYYLRQLHLTVLSEVLLHGILERSPAPLFVDHRLGLPKAWRDVYHYDEKGRRTGWTRHSRGRTWNFDASGKVLSNDTLLPVTYRAENGHLVFETPS